MTETNRSRLIFEGDDADEVADVLREQLGPLLHEVATALRAVGPGLATPRAYVRAYRELTIGLSRCAVEHEVVPQLLRPLDGEHQLHALGELLAQSAPVAPFSVWTTRYEAGIGVALHALDNLRQLDGLPRLPPPAPDAGEEPAVQIATLDWTSFFDAVRRELARSGEAPLGRVKRAFGLTDADLGGLFGVTRQAAQQWQARGDVPADRQAKLAVLVELAEVLEAQLQDGLLPGVARRPSEAYGGRTMLDVIAADEHEWLLEDTRRVFDWSVAA